MRDDEVRELENPLKITGSTIVAIMRLDVSKVELNGGLSRPDLIHWFNSHLKVR